MKTPYRMDGWSAGPVPRSRGDDRGPDPLRFKLGLWQCGPADWVFTSWDLSKRRVNQWGVDITNPAEVDSTKVTIAPISTRA